MSSSVLEQTREALELLELIDKAITTELMVKFDNPRESVLVDHKIKNLIDMKQNRCLDALILLQDTDGSRKEEEEVLNGKRAIASNQQKVDVWGNFYERYKEIRDYHKRHNPQQVTPLTVATLREQVFLPPYREPVFSGEEALGKQVDMNALYHEYKNLRQIREVHNVPDYLYYLQHFDDFHTIPYAAKDKDYKPYKRYLENLVNYLKEFFVRVQPLTDYMIVERQINEDFAQHWRNGTLKGWERKQQSGEEVLSNPLYCKSCKKLFQNDNTYVHHLDGKRHKKLESLGLSAATQEPSAHKNAVSIQEEQINQDLEEIDATERHKKALAYLECYVVRLKELLNDIVHDTANQIRRKQTRTYEEMVAENQNPEIEDVASESEDNEPVYNPKNLPVGWDGKPIPYWLYKLHGLGIEYKCEICGNFSYWGRRAFERHFVEWRHTYGMKCLKIPNSVHFREITSINDALALHQKLVAESQYSQFKPDVEEEFEDTEGNILNKKTYLDLKKQGLL